MVADNRSLAHFTLKGIPPMPAGMARLEVTFQVDADGLLSVRAKELTTGIEQAVSVKPSYGLDDSTVERMLLDALDHGEDCLLYTSSSVRPSPRRGKRGTCRASGEWPRASKRVRAASSKSSPPSLRDERPLRCSVSSPS